MGAAGTCSRSGAGNGVRMRPSGGRGLIGDCRIPDVASIRTLFPLFVPHAAFWFCILCVCAPALAVASEPLAWEWLGICAVVNATVEAPPVFSTVLKLLSDVLIPHRHPAATPSHPCTSKVGGGVGRFGTHIDTTYRIHRFCKLLDVFLQQHPIDFHIPVLGHLKGIILSDTFPMATPLPPLLSP